MGYTTSSLGPARSSVRPWWSILTSTPSRSPAQPLSAARWHGPRGAPEACGRGARRQRSEHHLRRRGPRGGGQHSHQRVHLQHRPVLHGFYPTPGPRVRLRSGPEHSGRRRAARSGRPTQRPRNRDRPAHQQVPARRRRGQDPAGAGSGRAAHHRRFAPGAGRRLLLEPTVLADLPQDAPIIQEEVFGPVLTVQSFSTEEEAIRLANSTPTVSRPGSSRRTSAARTESRRSSTPKHRLGQRLGHARCGSALRRSRRLRMGRESGPEALASYTRTKSVIVAVDQEAS